MMIVIGLIISINDLLTPNIASDILYVEGVVLLVYSVLFWAAWKGWPHAGLVIVLFFTVIVGFSMPEPYLTERISLSILLPPILATILIAPLWIIISGFSSLFILLARANWQGVYADTFNLLIYCMFIFGLLASRKLADNATKVAENALADVEQSALALQEANNTLEQRVIERTVEVEKNLLELEQLAQTQARLLFENEQQRQTIRNLSVPIIPVTKTTMVMPLVGELDQERIEHIHYQALQALSHRKVQTLIMDITGVPIVDTQVAQGIIAVAQAAQLLGGRIILVGIRPEVAQTIVGLGIDISVIQTYADLQSALLR